MRLHIKILFLMLIISSVWAGCSAPNAYKQKSGYVGYGYAGEIGDGLPNSNTGYALFSGDQKITQDMLKSHCLRHAAELASAKGYDYIRIIKADYYTGRAKEKKSRYINKGEDSLGKYENYWVWEETVDAKCLRLDFLALRGPLTRPDEKSRPPETYSVSQILRPYHGSAYNGKSLQEPAPVKCAVCGETNNQPGNPEHCDACGKYLFRTLICPFCDKETNPVRQGKNKCLHCAKEFRFSACSECGMEHILKEFRPFRCSFCGIISELGVESGKDNFRCPHCRKRMDWPQELHGEYACPSCKKAIIIHACPDCAAAHALDIHKPYTCWTCGNWIKFNTSKEKELACPHCQKIQTWPDGPVSVGLCLATGKKVYLAHCVRCDKWLALTGPGDFFCRRCGNWTGIYWCGNCKEFQRGDPNNPPGKCPRCSKEIGINKK
ncbi:MAG: hypothetical protein V1871_00085 [Planctomycetota bacterium]